MCGICGFVSQNDIDRITLKQMNDTMFHRGPDDSGEIIIKSGSNYIGLAQRRLSIIDLSPAGHQPMQSTCGKISIVFNGEIYNYVELKKELGDYYFKSETDTEVIIAGYLKWGCDVFNKLNGMFAIAIYDYQENKIVLARDRLGKKPLYYYAHNGEVAFASELKPIMHYPGFDKQIKKNIIGKYLYHGYINAPETIFKNTYKLEPGNYLILQDGKIHKEKYWNAIEKYLMLSKSPLNDYIEVKQQLTNIITDSVKKRMIADVPLGTFLSGGIDSTLVTALAQKNTKNRLKTFSIGFMEEDLNEAPYAKKVAEYLGTDHTELYIDEKTMLELVDSIPYYYDEPMADPSQIPMMLISKLAKKDVTVALSGDGGDELFCGYGRYDFVLQAQKYDFPGSFLFKLLNMPLIKQVNILDRLPIGIRELLLNRNEETKSQWGGQYRIAAINEMLLDKQEKTKYFIESSFKTDNWQQRLMLVDLLTVLPEELLSKVDRGGMKYSLETRCPLLDYRVMEFSFRIPHKYKYNNGNKKAILKDITYDLVPKEIMDRPKHGFTVPVEKWLRNDLCLKVEAVSSRNYLDKQGIFNYDGIRKILDAFLYHNDNIHSDTIWNYYIFQAWYSKYMGEV